jgi:iron complex outermembrane receptor protein
MSELINTHDNRAAIRWKLLTGASALALTAYIAPVAHAEDSAQPQIWIELGGQLSRLEDGQEAFSPTFPNSPARPSIFSPSQPFERPPLYSIDEFANISFQPDNSDWVFSASVRYGRSASNRHVHQQTYPKSFADLFGSGTVAGHPYVAKYIIPFANRNADTRAENSERHSVLDFQAGKDVGLGMFGSHGSSVVSLGVRFAQFASKSNITLKSDPDWHFNTKYVSFAGHTWEKSQPFHSNGATLQASRSFRGIGPSLSWNASTALAGNPDNSELTFDWGVNAALLFGRQRTKTHHQTTERYSPGKYSSHEAPPQTTFQGPAQPDHTRSRDVTVPNVGGFAGLSFKYSDAKLSFGYRADMFFGAIDGGIDARKSADRSFMGPYASISIGLGD